jgi:hypothetical protein
MYVVDEPQRSPREGKSLDRGYNDAQSQDDILFNDVSKMVDKNMRQEKYRRNANYTKLLIDRPCDKIKLNFSSLPRTESLQFQFGVNKSEMQAISDCEDDSPSRKIKPRVSKKIRDERIAKKGFGTLTRNPTTTSLEG